MLKKKDLLLISHLRRDGRMSLTDLSKTTKIPVSTIFDRIKRTEQGYVKKTVVLVNFFKLGFSIIAHIMIKVKKDREKLEQTLIKNIHINTIYRINNGFDYIIEAVFVNISQLEKFLEQIEIKYGIKRIEVHYLLEEIKKEEFLNNTKTLQLLIQEEKTLNSLRED